MRNVSLCVFLVTGCVFEIADFNRFWSSILCANNTHTHAHTHTHTHTHEHTTCFGKTTRCAVLLSCLFELTGLKGTLNCWPSPISHPVIWISFGARWIFEHHQQKELTIDHCLIVRKDSQWRSVEMCGRRHWTLTLLGQIGIMELRRRPTVRARSARKQIPNRQAQNKFR